jgi:hypothetical protein
MTEKPNTQFAERPLIRDKMKQTGACRIGAPKEETHGEKSLGALGGLRLPWPSSLGIVRKSTKEFIADGGSIAQCGSGTPADF